MPREWDTYRTECDRGRVTYHPEWSQTLPWAAYWQGTATVHFEDLDKAKLYFASRYNAKLKV